MGIFKKFDRIPPPYSTFLALGAVTVLGLLLFLSQGEAALFGLGCIAGGVFAIALKAAAEASDRQVWQRVRALFGGKNAGGPR